MRIPMRASLLMLIVATLCPTAVSAQHSPRGYVQAIGGLATTSATDVAVGGAGAVRVGNRIAVFGELGHLRNGIWKSLDDELSARGKAITDQIAAQFGSGAVAAFEARVPVWYGLGGGRVDGPRRGRLATYAEAGIG